MLIRSLFHFLHHCGIGGFRRFISISRTVIGRFFTILGEMTHADKRINPHSGTDPADIQPDPDQSLENPDSNPGSHCGLGGVYGLRVLLLFMHAFKFGVCCRAMLRRSAAFAVVRCPSVYCVQTNTYLPIFFHSPSSSHTILFLQYQTL